MLDDIAYPAGSWIFPAQAGIREALREVADRQGLEFTGAAAALPQVPTHLAKVPRLGLWVPWADTDSIGWVRYTLDQRKIPYIYLRDEDIRAGGLQKKSTFCCTDTSIWNSPSKFTAFRRNGVPCRSRERRRPRVTERRPRPMTSPEGSVGRGWIRSSNSSSNFNPLYRDMNRGDQRMLWNTIINWQAILQGSPAAAAATD